MRIIKTLIWNTFLNKFLCFLSAHFLGSLSVNGTYYQHDCGKNISGPYCVKYIPVFKLQPQAFPVKGFHYYYFFFLNPFLSSG